MIRCHVFECSAKWVQPFIADCSRTVQSRDSGCRSLLRSAAGAPPCAPSVSASQASCTSTGSLHSHSAVCTTTPTAWYSALHVDTAIALQRGRSVNRAAMQHHHDPRGAAPRVHASDCPATPAGVGADPAGRCELAASIRSAAAPPTGDAVAAPAAVRAGKRLPRAWQCALYFSRPSSTVTTHAYTTCLQHNI